MTATLGRAALVLTVMASALAVWGSLSGWRAGRPDRVRRGGAAPGWRAAAGGGGPPSVGVPPWVVRRGPTPLPPLPLAPLGGGGLPPSGEPRGMLSPPPMLYLGETALAVPFALTVAALVSGRLDGR